MTAQAARRLPEYVYVPEPDRIQEAWAARAKERADLYAFGIGVYPSGRMDPADGRPMREAA